MTDRYLAAQSVLAGVDPKELIRRADINRIWAWILLLAFAPGCAEHRRNDSSPSRAEQPGTFFVATNGNDSWSGHKPLRDRTDADGPFATLPRALRAAREYKQGLAAAQSTIFLRG